MNWTREILKLFIAIIRNLQQVISPNGFDLVAIYAALIPFLNNYFNRFRGRQVKLLVTNYNKSSSINEFSFAEHRLFTFYEVKTMSNIYVFRGLKFEEIIEIVS